MRRFLLSVTFLVFLSSIFSASYADKNESKIAAVVNEDLITFNELNDRVKLIGFFESKNLINSDEESLKKIALESLIDDKLFNQHADSLNIDVSDSEIEEKIKNIEESQNVPTGKIAKELKANNISLEAFKYKIKIDLIKSKIISQYIAPSISLPQKDIDDVIINKSDADVQYDLKKYSGNDCSERTYNNLLKIRNKISSCKSRYLGSYMVSSEYLSIKKSDFSSIDLDSIKSIPVNSFTAISCDENNNKYYMYQVCKVNIPNIGENYISYIKNYILNSKLSTDLSKLNDRLRSSSYIKINE